MTGDIVCEISTITGNAQRQISPLHLDESPQTANRKSVKHSIAVR